MAVDQASRHVSFLSIQRLCRHHGDGRAHDQPANLGLYFRVVARLSDLDRSMSNDMEVRVAFREADVMEVREILRA